MPKRVFIADDSTLCRQALAQVLAEDPRLVVVGEAKDGKEAVARVTELRPDIVLMDVMMPMMDGLEATARLMSHCAVPILIVSDLVDRDADLNFRALEAGAVDLVRKLDRRALSDPRERAAFARKVRALAGVPVVTRRPTAPRLRRLRRDSLPEPAPSRGIQREVTHVCMGASTGGPSAVRQVLESIGRPPWPVLVVQHISAGFTAGFVSWLAAATGVDVRAARSGDVPRPGVVLVAPEGAHLVIRHGRLKLTDEPRDAVHRPSVDALFHSFADSRFAPTTAAVLLTGMGADGARGLAALRGAGAYTIAQDSATSLVHGMPRVAAELGAASAVLPLGDVGRRLLALTRPPQ